MEFSEWFGKSKVASEDGEPRIVFHGTKANFDQFSVPAWFSPDLHMAEMFAGEWGDGERTEDSKVVAVYLSFQNPFHTDDWGVTEGDALDEEWRQELVAKGYDSVIFALDGEVEYIAFKPEQIMFANHVCAPESEFKTNNPRPVSVSQSKPAKKFQP